MHREGRAVKRKYYYKNGKKKMIRPIKVTKIDRMGIDQGRVGSPKSIGD